MPVSQDLIVAPALTDFALDFLNEQDSYGALKMLPVHPVSKVRGAFYTIDKSKLRRPDGIKRAQGVPATKVDAAITSTEFDTEEFMLDSVIDQQERDAFEPGSLRPEKLHMDLVMQGLMEETEQSLATTLTDPTNWPAANVFTPSPLWSAAASDPITDIQLQMSTVRKGIQKNPTDLFIAQDAWDVLVTHTDVRELIKHTRIGQPDTTVVASILGLQRVHILSAVKNTAKEGQTDVEDFVWTKDAFLMFINPNPTGATSLFGVHAEFESLKAGFHPKTDVNFDRVFAMWKYTQLITDFRAAVFFDGVIA